jgi:hypothetical protein
VVELTVHQDHPEFSVRMSVHTMIETYNEDHLELRYRPDEDGIYQFALSQPFPGKAPSRLCICITLKEAGVRPRFVLQAGEEDPRDASSIPRSASGRWIVAQPGRQLFVRKGRVSNAYFLRMRNSI